MTDGNVNSRMQNDWNSRAREDANYFVAFGRRDQDEGEFFATGDEMVKSIEDEIRRLPLANPRSRRALEIGCGPGRLMKPLSRHFGEIHGVDISDEMVALARKNLEDVPHAHPHHSPNSDLRAFADDSFDLVYSYAVFQHIPEREVVMGYFQEAKRVLRDGGIARFQINGLPETAARYDTWSGVRISALEVAEFARENDFQLLALEGIATQYMWTTWRKKPVGWFDSLSAGPRPAAATIPRITNTFSSEPVAPNRGRFSSVSLWVERLDDRCDLNGLEILVRGEKAFATYIGPLECDGLQQLNFYLPQGLPTGLHPVEMLWRETTLCDPAMLRVVPAGPPVPRVDSVSDGVDLLSGKKIVSGTVKVVLEELEHPGDFTATLGGRHIAEFDHFCTDPRVPKYEINFQVPTGLQAGFQTLEMNLKHRKLSPVELELV